MNKSFKVAIVDDEILARQRIEDLVAKESDLQLAGTAGDGNEAIEMIRRVEPDLLFLDIQMPGRSGLEVAKELGVELPVTVFTTAYDNYALQAFDVAAVDYLVKPFDDERFAEALRRARRWLMAPPSESHEYLERIPVESRGQLRVIPVAKVDYITASGPYAELHVGERTFAIRERMQLLEERLDPGVFFRIHRSAIVRLDRVDAVLHRPGGDYAVRLKDGTELSVSRSKREELERALMTR